MFEGKRFTFDSYLQTEEKYIKAANCFFQFHKCDSVVVKNLEKRHADDYFLEDKDELVALYNKIEEGTVVALNDLSLLVKLILTVSPAVKIVENKNDWKSVR